MTIDRIVDLAQTLMALLGAAYVLLSVLAATLPQHWRLTLALAVVAADLRRVLPVRVNGGASVRPAAAAPEPTEPDGPHVPPRT